MFVRNWENDKGETWPTVSVVISTPWQVHPLKHDVCHGRFSWVSPKFRLTFSNLVAILNQNEQSVCKQGTIPTYSVPITSHNQPLPPISTTIFGTNFSGSLLLSFLLCCLATAQEYSRKSGSCRCGLCVWTDFFLKWAIPRIELLSNRVIKMFVGSTHPN